MTAAAASDISLSLRLEFYGLGLLGVLGLALFAFWLDEAWLAGSAGMWLVFAAPLWGFVLVQTGRRLHKNRLDEESPLYTDFGWGTRLTLFRAWLICMTAGFLFQPWPETPLLSWTPGIMYLVAACIDRVDGFLARITRHSSILGGELDTVSDALGMAVVSLMAFYWNQIHASYLLVGIAYYAFIAGMMWRRFKGREVYPLPDAYHRRAWAGFQMGFLVVAIWPLFYPPVTTVAGVAFMLPLLAGFFLDWLYVSGRLNRHSPGLDRALERLSEFGWTLFQPMLRIAVVGLVLWKLWAVEFQPLPLNSTHNFLLLGGLALACTLCALGLAARAATLLLVGMIGWFHKVHPFDLASTALLCSTVWLMLLGPGRFSVWLWDDQWVNRYDGA